MSRINKKKSFSLLRTIALEETDSRKSQHACLHETRVRENFPVPVVAEFEIRLARALVSICLDATGIVAHVIVYKSV